MVCYFAFSFGALIGTRGEVLNTLGLPSRSAWLLSVSSTRKNFSASMGVALVGALCPMSERTVRNSITYPRLELREIAENLHHNEPTALERDGQVAPWAVTAAQVLQSATPAGDISRKKKGARRVAADFGIETTDPYRAVKVASLSPKAKQAGHDVQEQRW
jgi:hypothetical protein